MMIKDEVIPPGETVEYCSDTGAVIFPYPFKNRPATYINDYGESYEYVEYYIRRKFNSGTTGEVSFYYCDNNTFDVDFVIYNKRKTAWKIENEVTGKDGLEPLFWAKSVLLNIPYYCNYMFSVAKGDFTISLTASDDKRYKAYKRLLQDEGFLVSLDNYKDLYKIFNKNNLSNQYCFQCMKIDVNPNDYY